MLVVYFIFFFKQKTAYELRISDWSSDVCSSDLRPSFRTPCSRRPAARTSPGTAGSGPRAGRWRTRTTGNSSESTTGSGASSWKDRKSVVEGTSESVRVELGGRRILKTKNQ